MDDPLDMQFFDIGPLKFCIGKFCEGSRTNLYYFQKGDPELLVGIDTDRGFRAPSRAMAYAYTKMKQFHKQIGEALYNG